MLKILTKIYNVWSNVADINPYPVINREDFFIDQALPSYLKDHHPLYFFPYFLPGSLKYINVKKEFISNLWDWLFETLIFNLCWLKY